MFIDSLPETSFVKSFKKREGRLGFEEDALGAFRTKTFDLGRQIARFEFAPKFSQMRAKLDEDFKENRSAYAKIFADEYSFCSTQLVCPLLDANLGSIHAVQELPADLLSLITDPWISVRQAYVSGGTSNNEVIAIEKSFHQANNATYCSTEEDGSWYVDGHPKYSNWIEESKTGYNFLTIHPYYKYLTA